LITDAELCIFVSNFHTSLLGDRLDLLEFEISVEKILELKELGDKFERFLFQSERTSAI